MKKVILQAILLLFLGKFNSQILVKNLAPGLTHGDPGGFYRFDPNRIVFFGFDGMNYGIYITDGTNAGTLLLKNFTPFCGPSNPQYLDEFNVADSYGFTKIDTLGFYVLNGSCPTAPGLLLRTNGTQNGTKTYSFTAPTPTLQSRECRTRFFKLGANICWIYKTPGSSPTIYRLYRYNVLTNLISFVNLPNHYFSQDYGILMHRTLHNSQNGGASYSTSSNRSFTIKDVVTSGNYFYIYKEGWSNYKDSLFKIDAFGARQVVATPNGGVISNYGILINNKYLFSGNDPVVGNEPFCLNLSNNSLGLLKDINPYFNYSSSPDFIMLPFDKKGYDHKRLYFTADNADYGREFWTTDGTSTGTYLVKDFTPGPTSTVLYLTGNHVNTNYLGDSLITSNGADTIRVVTPTTITSYSSKFPYLLNGINSKVYFWRYGLSSFLLDNHGLIYKLGFSSIPIDTLSKLNCNSVSFPQLGLFSSVMELNGCLIINQKDCSFTGHELYKYCNSSLYTGEKNVVIASPKIRVFPNPSNGKFTFDGLIEDCLLEVIDLTGRIVYTYQLNESKKSINIEGVNNGVYLYKIKNKQNQVQQGKLMIEP